MSNLNLANEQQREAITTTEGPLLITAGPGTGKTFTLVQRALYLIEECALKPENILIATFTEKAAKELVTRLTDELGMRNIFVNLNEMWVGTFHSLCLRILKENLEFTRLKKNFRVIDSFDQQYLIFTKIYAFQNLDNYEVLIDADKKGAWKQAGEICAYVNTLSEEMVDPESLIASSETATRALGEIFKKYLEILDAENMLDFPTIQTSAFSLITENPQVLEKLQGQITHLMVDEYQDTNYIQERIVFCLGAKTKNICVVGDDDQGLYRFRGATIRNILEFPSKFEDGECKRVNLTVNYRSNSDIVEFYDKWMEETAGSKFKFSWDKYRFDKNILPHKKSSISSPAVARLTGEEDEDEWHQKVLDFIKGAKEKGVLEDYNQVAFLFRSVKGDDARKLANFLEQNGVPVYSPRSNMFFEREEIRIVIGALMCLFPEYLKRLESQDFVHLRLEHYEYYKSCIQLFVAIKDESHDRELLRWMRATAIEHETCKGNLDYAFTGLLYRLFKFEPFKHFLSVDLNTGQEDLRPVRNLALFTQLVGKFEFLNNITVFTTTVNNSVRKIDRDVEFFFNLYLRLLFDEGISEFEDDSEYAPSGCVSFMTVHQAKGMEFPVVFVDSLRAVPRKSYNDLMLSIEEAYFHRPPFEPHEQTKFFDFWRLYYTAFSRAQDLLILTCNEDAKTPSKYFREVYDSLPSTDSDAFNIQDFKLHMVKDVNIKETYSFTSHINVFENCSVQYKFFKELEFSPSRVGGMLFGTLVHSTIEDVHKAALRGEEALITKDNIEGWFNANYSALVKSEHRYLAEPQKQAALTQVMRYVERKGGKWSDIKEAEVNVSLVTQDFIIDGKIDLIKGEDDTVEIVDFKSEKKPDLELERKKLEVYRRQLHIYAYLVEQRTGYKVSRMHLYFTGEDEGKPEVTYNYTKTAVEGTVESFDTTVKKIMGKDFTRKSSDRKTCTNCDLRWYCMKMPEA